MRLGAIICVIFAAAGVASPALAQERVCIEEVGGVCLKYKEAEPKAAPKPAAPAPAQQRVISAEEQAERAIGLNRADRRTIQSGLKAEGFYQGAIDGAIGRQSRRAIAAWQQSKGRPATGFLSPSEVASLSRSAELAAAAATQPAPAPAPAPEPAPQVAPQPAPEPAVAAAPAAPALRGPIKKKQRGNGFDIELNFRQTSAATAEVEVALIQSKRLEDSCDIPMSGPFECLMTIGRFGRTWLRGELPNVTVFAGDGSNSPSGLTSYAFRLW